MDWVINGWIMATNASERGREEGRNVRERGNKEEEIMSVRRRKECDRKR